MPGARIILPPKYAAERVLIPFDFTSIIPYGDQVVSATTTAVVWSGTDATPSAIINGAVIFSFSNRIASQSIINGVPGVIYLLTCSGLTGTSGETVVITGYLAILPGVP